MTDTSKLALVLGSGIAISYFGLDRTISWLPKAVHYGVAGGATSYLVWYENNASGTNFVHAIGGAFVGIVGGEVTRFVL